MGRRSNIATVAPLSSQRRHKSIARRTVKPVTRTPQATVALNVYRRARALRICQKTVYVTVTYFTFAIPAMSTFSIAVRMNVKLNLVSLIALCQAA
jgi:hypothetical protein